MPRRRQVPRVPVDQPYGEKKRLDEALDAVERPEDSIQPSLPGGQGGPVEVPRVPMPGAPPATGILEAAKAMPPPGPSPWSQPPKPGGRLTDGIPAGPGQGPSNAGDRRNERIAMIFDQMAAATNDPTMHMLASRMRRVPR